MHWLFVALFALRLLRKIETDVHKHSSNFTILEMFVANYVAFTVICLPREFSYPSQSDVHVTYKSPVPTFRQQGPLGTAEGNMKHTRDALCG